jgi:molybdenum cofactor cytidylyltransferase
MTRIAGIVLAAGSSRRLGRPKQTLPLGDTTLLGRVLADAEASSLDPLVLVLGGAAGAPLAGAAPGRAEVVLNPAHGSGCASSLQAGMDAAGRPDAVVLILGDMPGVGAELIDAFRAAWEAARPWAAVTDYRGTPGHPLAFGAEAFPDLRALGGDKAVWKLLDAHPGRVLRVPVDRDLPRDVDTWEDYEEARRSLGLPGPGDSGAGR